jgi:ubiquitin-activating enzyme E1 C
MLRLNFTDCNATIQPPIIVYALDSMLNRQNNVGQPKAEVAAEFIMRRVPGVKVTPYYGKIQDKDDDYYKQFGIVVCGLDSIEARRWINAKLVSLVDENDPDSLKPLIDGGTEGKQALLCVPVRQKLTNSTHTSHRLQGTITSYPPNYHGLL